LLEAVPVVQVSERRVVRKSRAVARGDRAGIRKLEANKAQPKPLDHLRNPGQREALLVHVEEKVATAAKAVEVFTPQKLRE
jgi:hypothetical protein